MVFVVVEELVREVEVVVVLFSGVVDYIEVETEEVAVVRILSEGGIKPSSEGIAIIKTCGNSCMCRKTAGTTAIAVRPGAQRIRNAALISRC